MIRRNDSGIGAYLAVLGHLQLDGTPRHLRVERRHPDQCRDVDPAEERHRVAALELGRREHLLDHVREPQRLTLHHVEQLGPLLDLRRDARRGDRTTDRRDGRPELVTDRRDELRRLPAGLEQLRT